MQGSGPDVPTREMAGRTLVAGRAGGQAVVLDEPLSFWGGVDPSSGRLIDRRHLQAGADLAGRILVMPSGRGSSSSSSVLAESIRARTAPVAILLLQPDPILVVGAVVAQELYARTIPIVVLDPAGYATLRTGDLVTVEAGGPQGVVRVASRPGGPGERG